MPQTLLKGMLWAGFDLISRLTIWISYKWFLIAVATNVLLTVSGVSLCFL
jgi:hypothetical protein